MSGDSGIKKTKIETKVVPLQRRNLNKNKIVYYAHCTAIYNSPQEPRDIELLESLGFEVLNLNSSEHQEGCKLRGMDYFTELVSKCDVLAFRALPNCQIPAGVCREIQTAYDNNIPVIELPVEPVLRSLDVEQTRSWLRQLGQR